MRSCLPLKRTFVVSVALLAVLAVAGAGAAGAHALVSGSEPRSGSAVDRVPERVVIRVARKEATRAGDPIAVYGPKGNRVDLGDVRVDDDGTTISVGLRPDTTDAGEYQVFYQIMSADTHVISDHLRFTVNETALLPADGSLQLAGSSRPNSPARLRALGPPAASIVAAVVLFLAAGLVGTVGIRRRRRPGLIAERQPRRRPAPEPDRPPFRVVRTGEHRLGPIPAGPRRGAPASGEWPATPENWHPGGSRGTHARSAS
jgi:methionine-rich copper-binding protein CopC